VTTAAESGGRAYPSCSRGELVTLSKGKTQTGISAMTTPQKEQPIEERIGNMIGKIFCLFLFAFFIGN
jgi:hypothetical protein